MSNPKTVLVLCTGNSFRSQMGEAILNHDLAGLVRGISAGTSPLPKVADGAIEAPSSGIELNVRFGRRGACVNSYGKTA